EPGPAGHQTNGHSVSPLMQGLRLRLGAPWSCQDAASAKPQAEDPPCSLHALQMRQLPGSRFAVTLRVSTTTGAKRTTRSKAMFEWSVTTTTQSCDRRNSSVRP